LFFFQKFSEKSATKFKGHHKKAFGYPNCTEKWQILRR
jgi:hypothetical protein